MNSQAMFYINYEECKFATFNSLAIAFNGFILTMRNVNFGLIPNHLDSLLVLY